MLVLPSLRCFLRPWQRTQGARKKSVLCTNYGSNVNSRNSPSFCNNSNSNNNDNNNDIFYFCFASISLSIAITTNIQSVYFKLCTLLTNLLFSTNHYGTKQIINIQAAVSIWLLGYNETDTKHFLSLVREEDVLLVSHVLSVKIIVAWKGDFGSLCWE